MARSNYSAGKRQRERDKERKKREKEDRQRENREGTGGGIPIATPDEIQGGSMRSIEEVMEAVHGRASGDLVESSIPSRLYIGGLNWNVTEEDLRIKMQEFGGVKEVVIVTDRDTGQSRGFAFVTMADHRDGTRAIRKLDGSEYEGRTLVVRQATERPR